MTRHYRIGIRARLILNVLGITALSLWLLGLMLLRQNAAFLAAERRERGRAFAAAVETTLDALLDGAAALPPAGPRHTAVEALLRSLADDPAVDSLVLLDSAGLTVSSVGDIAAATAEKDAMRFDFPLSIRGAPAGSLTVRFASSGIGRQVAYAHLQVLVQLGITAIVLVIFLHLYLSLVLARPVRRLAEATERIAAGDLDRPVETGQRDELGDLAAAFNTMRLRLREVREVNERQLAAIHQANAEIVAKEEALVRAERMAAVGRVAAGVAHEVGNPLGAVTGYLALLGRGDLSPEERRDYLGRTGQEVARINRIMIDLLDWARPPRLEFAAVDVNALLRDLATHLASQPDFANVSVRLELADGLPAARADYHRARQMLLNIALNAAQAMPGGGTVSLESFRPREPAFAAGVRVRDDGPGISPEVRAHLFEPFVTAGKGVRGTGLGLAICRRTAETMGARIDVESGPGAGTRFTVLFPTPDTSPPEPKRREANAPG